MKAFTEYLEEKDFAKATVEEHIENVQRFLKWIDKEEIQIEKPDILDYLEHLKNKGRQNRTRQKILIALNYYFQHLFEEKQVLQNPCWNLKIRGTKKKIMYKIYTPAELETLFNNYYTVYVQNVDDSHITANRRKYAELCRERNVVILSVLINQGVIIKEISTIKISDLDLQKNVLRMRGGKVGRKRNIPLKSSQMGLFIYYLNDIYPQLLEYQTNENNMLFLPLPSVSKKETDSNTMKYIIYKLTKQLKIIDKNFTSLLQVRASVITSWLQTYGLRKAQYLAGHRAIWNTELYQANNLNELTENINNLHPFDYERNIR